MLAVVQVIAGECSHISATVEADKRFSCHQEKCKFKANDFKIIHN